jgi:hypothetical protein
MSNKVVEKKAGLTSIRETQGLRTAFSEGRGEAITEIDLGQNSIS